ncbi:MAG: putative glycoside hydrolase, partial [Clostridiales bacterium]|nr:putative glycoside hydrolase [Clostridiales bacterium]
MRMRFRSFFKAACLCAMLAPVPLRPFDYLLPPPVRFVAEPPEYSARGVYVTANSAGIPERLDALAQLCAESGMNSVVIDVRTENEVTLKNWLPFADEWGVSQNYIPDAAELMQTLEANNIYPIARMVTFIDGYTVNYRPELYIHNADGTVWEGPVHNGDRRYPWLNPYNKETWDYVLTYAIAAAELGFKEIQFDYVRFAATTRLDEADFGDTQGLTRTEIILEFLRYA